MKRFDWASRSLCWALLCLAPVAPRPAFAQDDAAPKTPAKVDPDAAAKAKLEIVADGELRLDGKIAAILGDGIWEMEAVSWTSPRGVTTAFDEIKKKGITVTDTAYIHPRGELEKVPLKDVKLGSRIAVIGKNGPDGVTAREVVLMEGYGSRKSVGQLSSNALTSGLVRQSREARESGQVPKAMALIDRAISTAQGMNDKSGEGLASQDKALLFVDMGQNEQALNTFKRVTALGREINNPLLAVLGLEGAGGALISAGRVTEAISTLKEADGMGVSVQPEIRFGVLSALAVGYMLSGQLNEWVSTLTRIAPLEEALGKDADAGETLLTIAAVQAEEKPDEARKALEDVKVRLNRARDDKAKATLTSAMAMVHWRLDEKDEAKSGFAEAAKLLRGVGDEAGAKKWDGMAANLEGVGTDWQEFFSAAHGVKKPIQKPEDGDEAPAADAAATDKGEAAG